MRKIQKGDQVKVMRGKLKGKITKVDKVEEKVVNRKSQLFVYLEGLNIFKKSVKPNPAFGIKGGFKDVALPVHISNVMLYNADTNEVLKKRVASEKANVEVVTKKEKSKLSKKSREEKQVEITNE